MTDFVEISRSLREQLRDNLFVGQLIGEHEQVLNYAAVDGRVVSLVKPALGMGPFTIMLPEGLWPKLVANELVISSERLKFGQTMIDLSESIEWEPVVNWPEPAPHHLTELLPTLVKYAKWTALVAQPPRLTDTLQNRALTLQNARKSGLDLNEAVLGLIGLGSGLTPAGDDYLLGFIAAAKYSHNQLVQQIKQLDNNQTTRLSHAFLRAALSGEFIQPWHQLATAIRIGDGHACKQALEGIENYGATSGLDALAGFAQTLLG